MGLESIPNELSARLRFSERRHACAILAADYPNEWADILACLQSFTLKRSDIVVGGGGRSQIPIRLDGSLRAREWGEKAFGITTTIDGTALHTPTHKLDNYKNRVGVEVEWNNKTEFFDRDLDTFRVLHELGLIAVGVIITRREDLPVSGTGARLIGCHWCQPLADASG